MSVLENVNSPKDLKKLDEAQLNQLCAEIREYMIKTVSQTGGHLASNLGVVELTVALHKVFNSPTDQIVLMSAISATLIKSLRAVRINLKLCAPRAV